MSGNEFLMAVLMSFVVLGGLSTVILIATVGVDEDDEADQ
jgi:hypothetical protein